MPEAVIVATARSPIGRAFKGSLTSIRPDDLLTQIVSAVLAKVPGLDPASIDQQCGNVILELVKEQPGVHLAELVGQLDNQSVDDNYAPRQ